MPASYLTFDSIKKKTMNMEEHMDRIVKFIYFLPPLQSVDSDVHSVEEWSSHLTLSDPSRRWLFPTFSRLDQNGQGWCEEGAGPRKLEFQNV